MGREILTFGGTDIEKNIYRQKSPTFLKDVDIEQVLVSNKFSFDEEKLYILYWLLV